MASKKIVIPLVAIAGLGLLGLVLLKKGLFDSLLGTQPTIGQAEAEAIALQAALNRAAVNGWTHLALTGSVLFQGKPPGVTLPQWVALGAAGWNWYVEESHQDVDGAIHPPTTFQIDADSSQLMTVWQLSLLELGVLGSSVSG